MTSHTTKALNSSACRSRKARKSIQDVARDEVEKDVGATVWTDGDRQLVGEVPDGLSVVRADMRWGRS
jgi:hypothetical protein